jgi:enoyl-CoA hydratase/carnithine racemase
MSAEFKSIAFTKEDGVGVITINRPQVKNAMDLFFFAELKQAVEMIQKDKEVRAVLITGAGGTFSSGLDLTVMSGQAAADDLMLMGIVAEFQSSFNMIEELQKPVIAAISGYALGAGMDLALACDLRIASEDAKFGEAYIRVGLIPDLGGTQRLHRIVGLAKAKELIFTGDRIDAKEAERIGLVNVVVSTAQLQSAAMEMAKKLAKGPTVAIGLAKMAMHKGLETDSRTGMKFEALSQLITHKTKDVAEGVMAFMQKRDPQFKGE